MVKCEVCGEELILPFTCSYCKGTFCSRHRLPESHNCRMLNLVKMQRQTYSETPIIYSETPPPPRRRLRISRITSWTEITHLLVAWVVLTICFSIRYVLNPSSILPLILVIYLVVVGTGFVSHELAHKFTAQRYGYWSEFRLWPMGLAIALFSSLLTAGSFIFAAPGATYVAPRISVYELPQKSERRRIGLMSLAGPLSNVAWAVLFLFLSGLSGLPGLIGTVGFQVNLWLAAFNMIPLGGLDGRKILSWSIAAWAAVAVPLWAVQVFLMLF
jgi:Zn-dependent protease